MKAGTLFRVGVQLIGVWSLFVAASSGLGFLVAFIRDFDAGLGLSAEVHGAAVIGQFLAPLAFAVGIFGFGQRLQTALLGRAADEPVVQTPAQTQPLLSIGLRLLGIYLLATYGGPQLATFFELVVVRGSTSRAFDEPQVISDLIANSAGLVAGAVCALRTEAVLARFGVPRVDPPPSS